MHSIPEGEFLWQANKQRSARTYPASALRRREKNTAVSCARKRDRTKRKSAATAVIPPARNSRIRDTSTQPLIAAAAAAKAAATSNPDTGAFGG
jgi:hypothetical protein